MVVLLVLAVCLGIAAFYPAPKRYNYPEFPTSVTDFNSPEYKQQQQQYDEEMKNYREKNKDSEDQRKIWGQNSFIVCLIAGVLMLILGLLVFNFSYFLGISLLFGGFSIIVFGPGIASYYAENIPIPLLGDSSKADLTRYKQIQFLITVTGALVGAGLSLILQKNNNSHETQT